MPRIVTDRVWFFFSSSFLQTPVTIKGGSALLSSSIEKRPPSRTLKQLLLADMLTKHKKL